MGTCTFCRARQAKAEVPHSPQPSQTPLLQTPNSGPTSSAVATKPPGPQEPSTLSRTNVLVAVGVALLALSLLCSGYLVLTVTGLRSKVDDEKAARASAEDRLTILDDVGHNHDVYSCNEK